MLRRKGGSRIATLVVVAALLGALACSPLEDLLGGGGPSVEITSPPNGTTAEVGQAVDISSTSESDAGIARVELLVDGEVVREDSAPEGNPTSFRLVQSWVPPAEGEVRVSVVAYDVDGQASDVATITLRVAAGAAEVTPTPVEDVETGDCTLNASFVTDITIPDDTQTAPGAPFVKGWRIENTGTCGCGIFGVTFLDQAPPTWRGWTTACGCSSRRPVSCGSRTTPSGASRWA